MKKFEQYLEEVDKDFFASLTEGKEKWIQGMHMKKNALKNAAKEAGESKAEYCEHPKTTKAKHRCALAKTLSKLPRHKGPRKED